MMILLNTIFKYLLYTTLFRSAFPRSIKPRWRFAYSLFPSGVSIAIAWSPNDDTSYGEACMSTYRMSIARDRKSTRLNSSHVKISYAVFCLKKQIGIHYTQDDS